jgi:alkanesulfonate monooxygenase SsuD/methylene tetrahydromethanopterin reductase-like flavin-dependent oxidoreductase (luciferase family)
MREVRDQADRGMCAVYITEDERQAQAECERAFKRFFAYNSSPIPSLRRDPDMKKRLMDSNYAFYAGEMMELLPRLSYEEIVTQDYAFVGTAERVLEQCLALKRAVDVDEIMIISHYGDIEVWKALRTQELFARDVIPKLR